MFVFITLGFESHVSSDPKAGTREECRMCVCPLPQRKSVGLKTSAVCQSPCKLATTLGSSRGPSAFSFGQKNMGEPASKPVYDLARGLSLSPVPLAGLAWAPGCLPGRRLPRDTELLCPAPAAGVWASEQTCPGAAKPQAR